MIEDEGLRDLIPLVGNAKKEFDKLIKKFKYDKTTFGVIIANRNMDKSLYTFSVKYKRDFDILKKKFYMQLVGKAHYDNASGGYQTRFERRETRAKILLAKLKDDNWT